MNLFDIWKDIRSFFFIRAQERNAAVISVLYVVFKEKKTAKCDWFCRLNGFLNSFVKQESCSVQKISILVE